MADRIINVNPSSDPHWTGGVLVKPSPESVININPINDNSECIADALEQLFWYVNNGGGGGGGTTNPQIEINRQNIGVPAGQTLSTSLVSQITALGSNLGTLSSTVSALSTFVGDSSHTSGLSQSVYNNAQSINTINTTISNLTTTISGQGTQISKVKTAVGIDDNGQLTYASGSLSGMVQTNTTDISTILSGIGLPTDPVSATTVFGHINRVDANTNTNTRDINILCDNQPPQSIASIVQTELSGYTPTIGDDSVYTNAIQDVAVTEPKLASGAVTNTKLGNGSVTEAKLANDAVTESKIADNSVSMYKLSAALQTDITNLESSTLLLNQGVYSVASYQGTTLTGNLTCNVSYKTYTSGYNEIYIEGKGDLNSGSIPENGTSFNIPLNGAGISLVLPSGVSTPDFSHIHIEYISAIIGPNANDAAVYISGGDITTTLNGSTWEVGVDCKYIGTQASNLDVLQKFRIKLCGMSVTAVEPSI